MPCQYCEICEAVIDLDEEVEHFEIHQEANDLHLSQVRKEV